MKKIKILLIGLLLILPFVAGITNVNAASKKINVYLFRGEGCPHCQEAEEWFSSIDDLTQKAPRLTDLRGVGGPLKVFQIFPGQPGHKLHPGLHPRIDPEAA